MNVQKLIVVLAAGAVAAGCCAKTPDWGAVKVQADGVRATCENWYAREGRLAVERCATGVIRLLYVNAGLPDRDMYILNAYWVQRQEIAQRQDAGQISALTADAEMAQARAFANSEVQAQGRERAAMVLALAPAVPPITCSTYRAAMTCN
jgi:hypothetical protein